MSKWTIHHADVLEALRGMPDNSADAVLSDVPYGLGTREPSVDEIVAYLQGGALDMGGDFMAKNWSIPPVSVWREIARVAKPGAPILAVEVRKNEPRGGIVNAGRGELARTTVERKLTSAASAASAAWTGYGTATKPSWEVG